jgi:hypothetical protein
MKAIIVAAALVAATPALAEMPKIGILQCNGESGEFHVAYDTTLGSAIYVDEKGPPIPYIAYLDGGNLIIAHDTPIGVLADEITPDGRWFARAVKLGGWREVDDHCNMLGAAAEPPPLPASPFNMARPFANGETK